MSIFDPEMFLNEVPQNISSEYQFPPAGTYKAWIREKDGLEVTTGERSDGQSWVMLRIKLRCDSGAAEKILNKSMFFASDSLFLDVITDEDTGRVRLATKDDDANANVKLAKIYEATGLTLGIDPLRALEGKGPFHIAISIEEDERDKAKPAALRNRFIRVDWKSIRKAIV